MQKGVQLMTKQDEARQEMITALQGEGYTVTKDRKLHGKTVEVDLGRYAGRPYKFAVLSCTHLGSKWQQLTHLHTFYEYAYKRGVRTFLHAGDLVDGEKMHRGHEYGIFVHGADAQVAYAVKNYPKLRGAKTLMLSGNHDLSFWKTSGVEVVARVARERKDIEYLGADFAFVQMGNVSVGLMHSRGSVAYARSYKGQRIVEQTAPERKSNFLFIGHYHVPVHVPGYRNVELVQLGCFQSQTDFLQSLGLYPYVGGVIVTFVPDERGLATITYEWVPFYKMIESDY
jgi:predicted phosphodiesterase